MSDQKVFRLTAVGPTSLYKAVESESVAVDNGVNVSLINGQEITPQKEFVQSILQPLEWTQRAVEWAGLTAVTSLGAFFQALDAATGDLGAGGISMVANALVIPQSVACRHTETARTALRAVFLAEPTHGTTTKTPAVADNAFIIGPSLFNGSELANIQSQMLSFGYGVQFNAGMNGRVRPTGYWLNSWAPVITLETLDLNIVKDYIKAPVELSASCCTLKFQNQAGNGGYAYTAIAGSVLGSIRNNVGTLRIQILKPSAGAVLAGAAY